MRAGSPSSSTVTTQPATKAKRTAGAPGSSARPAACLTRLQARFNHHLSPAWRRLYREGTSNSLGRGSAVDIRWRAGTRLSMTLTLAILAFDGYIDAAHGQEAETPQPPAQLAQDPDTRSGDIAEAEAALRQIQQAAAQAKAQIADAEMQLERLAAQRTDAEQRLSTLQQQLSGIQASGELEQQKLTDTTAQLERVTQQVNAAEQRLAAVQHHADDVQDSAAAAEKQLAESKAQLSQVAGQRSAAEQQLNSLQQQIPIAQAATDAAQQRLDETTARLGRVTQQVTAAEQQVNTLMGRVERGTRDASDAETRLAEARKLEEQRAAAIRNAMMIRRGDALLQQGDVSAARLVYERAAAAGSGDAATAMGKTFDAGVLAQIGVVGLRPDPDQASAWYRRALALGNEEARGRLQNLQPATERARASSEKRP